jgi:hypothetical protein
MRILIAALLGAIVMFLWEFVAHMLLPVGQMGFRQPQNEDIVLQSVVSGLPAQGIYLLPSIDPAKMSDPAATKAWVEKSAKSQFAFVVLGPTISDPTAIGPNLIKQFVSDFLAAEIVALILAATAWGFGARVFGSAAFGVFGWLANIVPQWNWYRFPSDFLVGNLVEQGVGWLLGGFAIAWWLGRQRRRL